MKKESFIKDANHIVNEKKKMKRRSCWNCNLITNNILDKFGCCKRCGTNLTKYKKKRDLPYPKELLGNKGGEEKLTKEVLGWRDRFTIDKSDEQSDW